ncbi:MAG: hypothetical protein AAGJ68_03250 [Pseudomonadota bacterium]
MQSVLFVSVMLSLLFCGGCLSPLQKYKLGMDTCGLKLTKPLIGKPIADVDLNELFGEEFRYYVSDPNDPNRVGAPTGDGRVHVRTANLRTNRQNLVLDEDGNLVSSYCG